MISQMMKNDKLGQRFEFSMSSVMYDILPSLYTFWMVSVREELSCNKVAFSVVNEKYIPILASFFHLHNFLASDLKSLITKQEIATLTSLQDLPISQVLIALQQGLLFSRATYFHGVLINASNFLVVCSCVGTN